MQFLNKKRIAYLASLTLLFSYAEILLPRFLPFFRLGLSNIVILLALNLNFPSFVVLTFIKAVTVSMMNGTLISPFFVISLVQSILSGILMYGLFRIKSKWLSLYGISIAGSTISAITQIGLSSLYLGNGTELLLGPMLLFNLVSALITAFAAGILKIPDFTPELKTENSEKDIHEHKKDFSIFSVICIFISVILIFAYDNLIILGCSLIAALIFQLLSGRKLLILPHISMWIFVVLTTMFVPSGKVWLKIGNLSLTEGAFLLCAEKSLKLSITMMLSQCAASIRPAQNSTAGLALKYFSALCTEFKTVKGNIFHKIKTVFRKNEFILTEQNKRHLNLPLSTVMLFIFSGLFIIQKFVIA